MEAAKIEHASAASRLHRAGKLASHRTRVRRGAGLAKVRRPWRFRSILACAAPSGGVNDSLACAPPVRAAGRADQASSRSKVIKGSGARARQPVGVQTMRAGGSSPRLTAVSTGLRPCVRRACRVSSATEPCSSRSIASRETSTRVLTSRPSDPVDRTDQEAQTLLLSGESLVDSLTLHPPPIRSP